MSSPPASISHKMESQYAFAHRTEIDGLRAISVIAVVFHHAALGFPGGYIGVDIFFVISGFLITSLMVRDLQNDCFSFADFWERRMRRIIPALTVMVLACILIAGFIFPPSDYKTLGKTVIAQALMMSNFLFLRWDSDRGGYFAVHTDERPLLHTWSLSVEEQFYLVYPFVIVGLYAFACFRSRERLNYILLVCLLVGFALAAISVHYHPVGTFYLLPTRAWELLCGAWLATVSSKWVPKNRAWREGLSWLGLIVMVVPMWLYSKETLFPGIAALPPCIGASCIILSNTRTSPGEPPTVLGKWLSFKPMVFIGVISYSLYLWHWPALVFGEYLWLHGEMSRTWSLGLIIISFGLAVLSWRFVETPFRKKRVAKTRKAMFRLTGISFLQTLLLGGVMVATNGVKLRVPEIALLNDAAKFDTAASAKTELDINRVRDGKLIPLGSENAGKPAQVLLWGDSHAICAIPALDTLLKELDLKGVAATRSSTPPLLDFIPDVGHGAPDIREYSEAVMNYVQKHSIPHVLLSARWSGYNRRIGEKEISSTVAALNSMGCKVWILQDVPDVDTLAPKALALEAMLPIQKFPWRRTLDNHLENNAVIYHLSERNLPAQFMDPAEFLVQTGSRVYRAEIDGISIYSDSDHLTTRASLSLLLPLLRDKMSKQLK